MSFNDQLVVQAFTQMYFLSLSTLVVYNPYSILSDLFTTCTYLLLGLLLTDKYGNLFNNVIKIFLLISKMLIYIFLLLSNTIILYVLLATQTLAVVGFAIWACHIFASCVMSCHSVLHVECLPFLCSFIFCFSLLPYSIASSSNARKN